MAIADDRSKAVEIALAQIEKQFGKGSIVRLGSREALLPIAVISTGSISFDAALGVGGGAEPAAESPHSICRRASFGGKSAIERRFFQQRHGQRRRTTEFAKVRGRAE